MASRSGLPRRAWGAACGHSTGSPTSISLPQRTSIVAWNLLDFWPDDLDRVCEGEPAASLKCAASLWPTMIRKPRPAAQGWHSERLGPVRG